MQQSTSNYSDECAAGREAAAFVLHQTDMNSIPRLVRSIREAVADGDSGHGIGFLFAIAAAAVENSSRDT